MEYNLKSLSSAKGMFTCIIWLLSELLVWLMNIKGEEWETTLKFLRGETEQREESS